MGVGERGKGANTSKGKGKSTGTSTVRGKDNSTGSDYVTPTEEKDEFEFFVVGKKLTHSFSPQLHSSLMSKIFDDDAPRYGLREVTKKQLASLMRERKFKGINVTIPYKQAVVPFLDQLDERARRIGSANTVVNRDGRLYGYNTDYDGMKALIERCGIKIEGEKVLVLGSGGTGRTACVLAEDLGAREVHVVSQSPKNGAWLPSTACGMISYEAAVTLHRDATVIINTTPAGMYPNIKARPLSLKQFRHLRGVVDVIYNPLRSNLVLEASARGIRSAGGLYMLVAQAAAAERLFFGKEIDESVVESVFQGLLFEKENIVFSGMAGVGKTTYGRMLAKKLGRSFLDVDVFITKSCGMKVEEIFLQRGEDFFRKTESEVIARLARNQGKVISLGGGAVLSAQNVWEMKRNGRVFFLDKDVSNIKLPKGRPLIQSIEELEKKYEERYKTYCRTCDRRIKLGADKDENFKLIAEMFGISATEL